MDRSANGMNGGNSNRLFPFIQYRASSQSPFFGPPSSSDSSSFSSSPHSSSSSASSSSLPFPGSPRGFQEWISAIQAHLLHLVDHRNLVRALTDVVDFGVNHYRDILWRGIQAAISDHVAQVSEHVLWYVFSLTNRLLRKTHRGIVVAVVFLLALRSLKGPSTRQNPAYHSGAGLPVVWVPHPVNVQQPNGAFPFGAFGISRPTDPNSAAGMFRNQSSAHDPASMYGFPFCQAPFGAQQPQFGNRYLSLQHQPPN
eukprot:ANDGO_04026.mRNA.1 hypothetical protein